ncbi:hypothetical protein LXL04_000247 [Taraxacum kok-saghyz]
MLKYSYRGPNYDSDFEVSEFEGDESDESSDSGFVVDPDQDDSDVEAKDEEIKEDGVGLDTAELDRESDDEVEPIEYGMHDPNVDRKKMKPHLGERVVKSSSDRIQTKCGTDKDGEQCTFKMWASWMNRERSFQVKGFNDKHTCIRDFRRPTMVNPEWIAKHFIKLLCRRPKMKGREIQEAVKKKFLCEVSLGQCYRAKQKALEIINGKLTEHYARIWDYGEEILRSNPGHCKGELVTAIGRDGNNQLYDIAWAVIDGKQVVDESEGLHDVAVVLTFKGHADVQDLIQSYYTEVEVLMALVENLIEVQQITPSPEQEDVAIAETQDDVDLVAETQDQVQRETEEEAGIKETQHQVQNEELPAGIGEPQDLVQDEEMAAGLGEPHDLVQDEEMPAPRTRKKSQRIVKIKLGKKIGGPGATSDAPYSLD